MSTLYSRRLVPPTSPPVARLLRDTAPASSFDAWLAFTIGYGVPGYGAEGGEANVTGDPGGFTWRGITLTNFRNWRGNQNATSTQLLQMPEDEIVAFYGCDYFNPVCGNQLPGAVAVTVADMAVNAGPREAAILLQRGVGADQDGSIGPMTLASIAAENVTFLLGRYTQLRHDFYASLSGYSEFGQGWDARTDACEAAAMALLPAPVSAA